MPPNSLYCAEVLLRNCSLTSLVLLQVQLDSQDNPDQLVIVDCKDPRDSLDPLVLKVRLVLPDSLVDRETEV